MFATLRAGASFLREGLTSSIGKGNISLSLPRSKIRVNYRIFSSAIHQRTQQVRTTQKVSSTLPQASSTRKTINFKRHFLSIRGTLALGERSPKTTLCVMERSSKGDLVQAEKDCIDALNRLRLEKDEAKERICIEKLGDIYQRKETQEALVQAAGLYNYVLRLAEKGNDIEVMNRMRQHLVEVERTLTDSAISNVDPREVFEKNREEIKRIRDRLNPKILNLSEDAPEEVQEVLGEISKEMKGFVRGLIAQSVAALGPSPCEFAVIGLGSLAREEMTPYSDLEFGILLREETEETERYFVQLTHLLHLKVVNLGETILPTLVPSLSGNFYDSQTPRGLAFDGEGTEGKGSKTPLGNGKTFALLHTPEKMAQFIGKTEEGEWWFEKEKHLPMEMLNYTLIEGDDVLVEEYRKAVNQQLSLPINNHTLREHLARVHLVDEDEMNFDPTLGNFDDEGRLFQVKQDLYRLPHLSIDRLALLLNIESHSTFDRVNALGGILKEEGKQRLRWLMGEVIGQRLKVYAHYEKQCEFMNPLLHIVALKEPDLVKEQFALNPGALENLTKIYQILIPFYRSMQAYLRKNPELLREEVLWDETPETLGKIAARLMQYEKAKRLYLQALEENPQNTSILSALGFVFLRLGKHKEALSYFKKALELRKALLGEEHPDVAIGYNNVGAALQGLGEHKEALNYLKKALELFKVLLGEKHPDIAAIYNNVGLTLGELDRHEEALSYQREALELSKIFLGEKHPAIAISLDSVGATLRELQKYEEALHYQREALELRVTLLGKEHPDVATSYNNMAETLRKLRKYEEALSYDKKALELRKELLGEDHPDVAKSYDNLGATLGGLQKHEEALSYQRQALELRIALLGKEHPDVATSYNNMGGTLGELGKLEEALSYQRQALELRIALLGKEHPDVARSYNNVGMTLGKLGKHEEALNYLKKALELFKVLLRREHPDVMKIYHNTGFALWKLERHEEALSYLRKALELKQVLLGEEHPDVATSYNNVGMTLAKLGKHEKALSYFKKALEVRKTLFGEKHPDVVRSLDDVVMTLRELGKHEEALSYQRQALECRIALLGEKHLDVAISYNRMGGVLLQLGKYEEALSYLKKALELFKILLGEKHPDVMTSLNNVVGTLRELERHEELLGYQKQELELKKALLGERHLEVAISYNNVMGTLVELERYEEALDYQRQGLELLKDLLGEKHPNVAKSYDNMAVILWKLGKREEALSYKKKALEIREALLGDKAQ